MRKTYIISEKDFGKYGIENHYDLEAVMCQGPKSLPKSRNARRRNIWQAGKPVFAQSSRKSVSKIKGQKTDRIVKGFASTFQKDRAKDIIELSAMMEAEDDLIQPGANTVFLNHDTDKPIGRVLSTKVDKNKGLYVEVMISKAADVEDIWTKIKEGVLNAFSIRLRPKKVKVVENTETHTIEEFRILSMELFEVSIVGLPMNAGALVTEVVGKSFSRAMENINKKKGSQNMATARKNVGVKKSTNITKEEVQSMIQEANAPMLEVMKSIQESLTANPAEPKTKKVTTKKKAAPVVKENPLEETIKSLQTAMDSLSKKFERRNRRKGASHEESDVTTTEDGTPKKVLKSVNDADTLKYVFYAATNSNEYEKLTDEERTKVKGWYLLAADVIAKGA